QYEGRSPDGINWTAPAASVFESPTSPMLIERNPYSGIYYAIWNPYARVPGTNTASGRTPLVIAQSRDGINFSGFTLLESDPDTGFCYPAIGFLSKNEMLVSYCFGPVNTAKQLAETRIRLLYVD
nr:exo-alpha-sialidase [Clostridia bacterium]